MDPLDPLNFSELRDAEIVARMRQCNYEKFKTLVRMHLSFELDLNTDEFDLPCHEIVYEDKGKVRKWNRLSKKHKHGAVVAALASGSTGCASAVGIKGSSGSGSLNCGGSPTEGLHQQIDQGFLFHLQELKEFLTSEKNIQQEGIFRKAGSSSRQNDLRLQIQNDKPLDLEASGYSAHDCATVFKGYLAELPEPLLTDAHYPAHLQIAPLCLGINLQMDDNSATNEEKSSSLSSLTGERLKKELHVLNSIQLLLLLLPDENRQLLQHIIDMLHAVALQQNANKMGPDNLATLFAPHLICPRNLPPEALHFLARKMSSIISYMIIRAQDIFAVPAKLATDIRAYFLERKRKKTMSPEMMLDESISDISTVNTVYTFVDREKTAAAHNANTTDTELAQLYAHIQSLPESSKKRRLIKQFNKQNGQGTPLQLQAMNRLKSTETTRSSKSLSDSIKKHIFNKGIMSRTPKRQPIPAAVLETPNNSSMKHHKQRVLFQSPNPPSMASSSNSIMSSTTTCTSSSSLSMTNSINCGGNLTPYIIKSHPLQKSISSTSLLMSQQQQQSHHSEDQEYCSSSSSSSNPSTCTNNVTSTHSNSSDGFVYKTKTVSVSAPVSRQTSSDLQNHINTSITSTTSSSGISVNQVDPTCCVTPLKLISEAAKQLIAGVDKKSVAWDDSHLIDIEHITHPSTPLQQTPSNDFKSRYKSEPNLSLSLNICDTPNSSTSVAHDMITPIAKLMPGKYITRKLMKGVSMGNLKFPFSTPESTKRLVRTVSSSLKRRSSDDSQIFQQTEGSFASAFKSDNAPLLQDMDDEDLDDDTFEDDPADHCGSDAENDNENYTEHAEYHGTGGSSSSELPTFTGGSASYQQLLLQQSGIYRNLDLVTSTPSLLLGRRSMSPITKSTQRMPKAMQESIMTPRSRKPVMVLTTTTGSTDQNQTINHTTADMSDFRVQEEELDVEENEEEEDETEEPPEDEDEEGEDDSILGVVTKTKPLDHQLQSNPPPPQPEVINEDATSLGGYSDIFKRQQLLQANRSFVMKRNATLVMSSEDSSSNTNSYEPKEENGEQQEHAADVLSEHFKEYLLRRSVLTAPPEDASFTSHSDDFESSREMDDMDENRLSSSLLYCLDGNRPESDNDDNDETTTETNEHDEHANHQPHDDHDDDEQVVEEDEDDGSKHEREDVTTTASSSTYLPLASATATNRLANNPFVILNNARKRAATNDIEKMSSILFNSQQRSPYQGFKTSTHSSAKIPNNLNSNSISTNSLSNKENCEHNETFATNKKLIISEGETSF